MCQMNRSKRISGAMVFVRIPILVAAYLINFYYFSGFCLIFEQRYRPNHQLHITFVETVQSRGNFKTQTIKPIIFECFHINETPIAH